MTHKLTLQTHAPLTYSIQWHCADLRHPNRTILEEYLADGGDQREAERCLRELNVPGVHFQFVKIAVTLGMHLCVISYVNGYKISGVDVRARTCALPARAERARCALPACENCCHPWYAFVLACVRV